MTQYVALLRGIAPLNPNMHNEKLRGVFEALGFQNVQTVISSGNVLFETKTENVKTLENAIEKALLEKLGFTSTTIVLNKDKLQEIADQNPFIEEEPSQKTYLIVTFLKNKPNTALTFPHVAKDKSYSLLKTYDQAVFSRIDLTGIKTP